MRRFLNNPWHTPLGWILLLAVLCVAAGEKARGLLEPDAGYYHILQGRASAPRTAATLTTVVGLTETANRIIMMAPTTGQWTLESNVTVPATRILWIPFGFKMKINSGVTLTLAACPKIDAPGWLTSDTAGKVHITATGCPIHVEQFVTGGTGSVADPWTGWDTALIWESGGTSQETHSGRSYSLGCGSYRQVAKIILNHNWNFVMGDQTGGWNCVTIYFVPTGSADSDGYFTAWEFGGVGHESFNTRFENIELTSADLTHKKRAVHVIDMSHFTFRNNRIFGLPGEPPSLGCGGTDPRTDIGWCDTVTYGSVGLYIDGREFLRLEDSQIYANYPTYLAGTPPTTPGGIPYNLDVTSFFNMFLVTVPLGFPNPNNAHTAPIYFDPLVFVTNFDVAGTCSLIGGHHAIYFDQSAVDPNRPPASANMTFANCRTEGFDTPALGNHNAFTTSYRYWFVGQSSSSDNPTILTHNITFTNMVWVGGGVSKGWYLKNVGYVLFVSCNLRNTNAGYVHDNQPNIAVHLGENAYPVTFLNSWVVDTSFIEMTGNQCIYFNSGANGRYGPFRGAPLVVVDANDTTVGCTQLPFTPTIPDYPATPATATSPPMNAGQPFIPMLKGDTGGGGGDNNVYAERYGYWTRSGKIITVFARVVLSTKGTWAGTVSLYFANNAVATGNKPPPPPSALQANNQGLTVRYGNVTLPFAITCVEGTPNTCTVNAGSITQLSAVIAPHYNEPPGTEPANYGSTSGNVLFLAMGSGVNETQYLDWTKITNTTTLEVSGSYITEH